MEIPDMPNLAAKRARWAISGIFLVFGGLFGTWLPYIPDAKANIGANEAAMGQALLFSGLGALLVMQGVGALIHRFGSRNVSVIGGLGACITAPFLLHQTSWIGLCLNLLCLGLFYGALDVAMNAHSLEVQALHRKSILASIHGWFSVGGIVGGFGASWAARSGVSPQIHLGVTAGVLAVLVVACGPALLPSSQDRGSEGPTFAWPKGIFLLLGSLCAASFVVEEGILSWSALHLRQTLQAEPAMGGLATGLSSGAMALGRFLGDKALAAFGNRKTVQYGGVVALVGVLGAAFAPTPVLALAGFFFACLGLSNAVPALFKEAGDVPGYGKGVGLAAVTTCGYAGFLAGPPLIGLLAHQTSLPLALAAMGMLGLFLFGGGAAIKKAA